MKDLRVVFMGTPEFSVPVLKELINATNVVMVVTQPDKPVGRKRIMTPSPVKVVAEENGIKIIMISELGERLEFPSINAARLHFKVRFEKISQNKDTNKPILIKGVNWTIYSK